MKLHILEKYLVVGTLLISPAALSVLAQSAPSAEASAAGENGGSNPARAGASNPARAAASAQRATVVLSDGVGEILKMADAGVSKDVIKVYVECSAVAYNPRAADLIAMKEHGLTDDITTAMMKRGAEIRSHPALANADTAAQQASPGAAANPPTLAAVMNATGQPYLDPESHDFWFYHYLYPRTLSYAYQRLSPYSAPYSFYPGVPFGMGQPFGPTLSTGYPRFGISGFRGRPF